MFAYKTGDEQYKQYKLTIELLSFFFFFRDSRFPSLKYHNNDLNEIVFIVDVSILCSYIRT